MKNKKIFACLILAVLFAVPQAVAQASNCQGTYSGMYTSSSHFMTDKMEFTIEENDELIGMMMVRGAECLINLRLIAVYGHREVYRGDFTRKVGPFEQKFAITMDLEPISDIEISGHIRIPALRFEATFIAQLPALP